MIYTALDNFYVTPAQLEATPSRADGVDAATEAELRRYCCDVVNEAAVLLKLPQVVAATAQVLIQRFYCKRSLRKFDVKVVAMAAFWLAAKLEEVINIDDPNRLTLRNVVTVVDRVTRRRDGRALTIMDPFSTKYEMLKKEACDVERHMLRAFGFVVHVEHPHRFILNYCQMLMKPGDERQHALQQEAWNMANDSLRTTLCVRFRAEVVACGILFTAARKLKFPLPESPRWWLLFEVTEDELAEVCCTLCDLYSQPRPQNKLAQAAAAAAAGKAAQPPGGRSPLSQQPTAALRSPTATGGAGPSLGAARRGSDGEAPSVAQQTASTAAARGDGAPSAASSPARRAANGSAAAGKERQRDREKEGDSRSERRRRSASRSRSRSRGHDPRRRRSSSRSRSRSADRDKRRRSGRDSPSRSPAPSGKDGGKRDEEGRRRDDRRRERREDQPVYRPGARSQPRDDRRREGHRERDHRGGGSAGGRR